jgi:hypothetical protein
LSFFKFHFIGAGFSVKENLKLIREELFSEEFYHQLVSPLEKADQHF